MATPHKDSSSASSRSDATASTTVLAFDFGEKHIGIAVGDLTVRIAHPLATVDSEDGSTRFAEIAKLVAEWRPCRFVVGLPLHPDGAEHEITRLTRRFARRLEGRFGVPAALVDERYTSRAAETRLLEAGAGARAVEASIDAAAACEILEQYFAAGPSTKGT